MPNRLMKLNWTGLTAMDGTEYLMTRLTIMVLLMVLNAAAAILNFSIGGWNILTGIFSLIVTFYCAYVATRIYNNTW